MLQFPLIQCKLKIIKRVLFLTLSCEKYANRIIVQKNRTVSPLQGTATYNEGTCNECSVFRECHDPYTFTLSIEINQVHRTNVCMLNAYFFRCVVSKM